MLRLYTCLLHPESELIRNRLSLQQKLKNCLFHSHHFTLNSKKPHRSRARFLCFCQESVFKIEGFFQISNFLIADMDDIAKLTGIEDGVGSGFHNLKAIKGAEQ